MTAEKRSVADRIGRLMGTVSRELFLIFAVLKLVGVIDWSWWWVTVPLWGLIGSMLLLVGLAHFIEEKTRTEPARV
jgi:hypothetical protein